MCGLIVGNRHQRIRCKGGELLLPSVLGRGGPLERVARSCSALASYTNLLVKPFRNWGVDVRAQSLGGHLTLEVLAKGVDIKKGTATGMHAGYTVAFRPPLAISHSGFLFDTRDSRICRGALGGWPCAAATPSD